MTDGIMSTTFNLKNKTRLAATEGSTWVAGWINGGGTSLKTLNSSGIFVASGTTLPFTKLDSDMTVTLNEATNGDDRFIFVVCPDQPAPLTITG